MPSRYGLLAAVAATLSLGQTSGLAQDNGGGASSQSTSVSIGDGAATSSFLGGPGDGGGGGESAPYAPKTEWHKRQNAEERMQAHGHDLLGDSIDPATGGISFETTDVSLPGNSALPVAITRSQSCVRAVLRRLPPREELRGGKVVPPRHSTHRLARPEALGHDPRLLLSRPPTTPLSAQHLSAHLRTPSA